LFASQYLARESTGILENEILTSVSN